MHILYISGLNAMGHSLPLNLYYMYWFLNNYLKYWCLKSISSEIYKKISAMPSKTGNKCNNLGSDRKHVGTRVKTKIIFSTQKSISGAASAVNMCIIVYCNCCVLLCLVHLWQLTASWTDIALDTLILCIMQSYILMEYIMDILFFSCIRTCV